MALNCVFLKMLKQSLLFYCSSPFLPILPSLYLCICLIYCPLRSQLSSPSTQWSVYMSICLSVCLSVCMSPCPVCLSISQSACLLVCLSVSLLVLCVYTSLSVSLTDSLIRSLSPLSTAFYSSCIYFFLLFSNYLTELTQGPPSTYIIRHMLRIFPIVMTDIQK